MKKTGLLLCLLVFLMSNVALAQNRQITGNINDDAGKPVADATVLVKGTTISTKTNEDGAYSVSVPSSLVKVELVISHVNFDTRTITAQGSTANTSLTSKDKQLDDVVIIGYGTQKKRNVTGAVANYNAEKLDERPVQRVDQALIGQMAGVQVKQTTGGVGKPFSINVRGTGSIAAGNEPLYVIDGFPISSEGNNSAGNFENGSPLDNLNPNDIENIQVLKDAAAAAIYGSRASNGVVIITTKKGKRGKNQITFNTYTGITQAVKKIDLLSAEEWIDRYKYYIDTRWVASGAGRTADQTNDEKRAILNLAPGTYNTTFMYDERWDLPGHPGLDYIDWQDKTFRTGNFQNYQLSASGGNEKARYFVSGTHQNNTGYVQAMTFKTYSARANIDVNLTNNMKFGINISPSYSIREDPGLEGKDQTLHKMVSMAPVQETANLGANGRYTTRYTWAGSAADESGRLDYIGESTLFRTLASAYFEVELLKGLVAKSTFNFDNADNVSKSYTPSNVLASIRGGYSSYRKQNFVNENTLSYTKSFKNVHNFNALAGYSYNTYRIDKVSLSSGALYTNYSNTTLPANSTGSTNEQKAVLLSYYSRLMYDYKGKYLFSASIRKDGSSRFGAGHRWGTFPSASIGWRISDENFFNVKAINELKLRASYGAGGNNSIGNYASYALLTAYNYGLGGGVQLGTGINGINNPDLHWESSYTNNIGLDASFLNGRISTSIDYYVKTNKDLLLNRPSLGVSGATTYLTNIGEVRNKGLEVELNTRNVVRKDFQWNTSLNVSHNENRLMKLDGEQSRIEIATNSFGNVPFVLMEVGLPMYSIYVVKQNGVLTQEDIDKGYPMLGNQKAGDPRYVDFDGDGTITQGDRQVLGQPSPKYFWGITNTFKYKNWDLTVLVQGQNGGNIYSLFGRAMNLTGMSVTQNALDVDVKTRGNYYTNFGSIVNSDWLYKSDYVSVRSINLGFNLKSVIKSDFVKGARVYLSADNLFYKDKYAGGYNPEATNINLSGDAQYPVPGDYGGLPVSKSFVLGVNFTF